MTRSPPAATGFIFRPYWSSPCTEKKISVMSECVTLTGVSILPHQQIAMAEGGR